MRWKIMATGVLLFFLLAAGPTGAHASWLTREFRNFSAYPRLHKAYDYYQKGEYRKARKLFESAVKIDPKNQEAIKALAETCLKLNDLTCAKHQGTTLNRLAPTSASGNFILARVANLEKNPNQAVDAAKAALHLTGLTDDQRNQLVQLLADNLIKTGNIDQAGAELLKLKKTTTDPELLKAVYDRLIDLCFVKNNIPKGLKWYRAYVKEFGVPEQHTRSYWSNLLAQHGDIKNAYRIIDTLPSRGTILTHKVNLLEKLGQYQKAADLLSENATPSDKRDVQYWRRLATLYNKAGDIDREFGTLVQSIKTVKGNTPLFNMAMLLLKGETKEHHAKVKIKTLEAAYPFSDISENYRFEFIMGLIHLEQRVHNEDRAKTMVHDLARWTSMSHEQLERLASLAYDLSMYKIALILAQRVISKSPQSVQAHLIAGYASQKLDEPSQAIIYLREAARLRPHIKTRSFYTGLGALYEKVGDKPEALGQWKTALALEFDPELALKMARLYHDQNENNEAQTLLSRIDPTHFSPKKRAEFWSLKGLVAEKTGDLKAAAEAYRKSLSNWETAETWGQLGYVYIRQEKKPEAIKAFREAAVLAPDKGDYRASLAYLLSEIGKPEEAAAAFRDAIRLEPDNISLQKGLGYCEIKAGNYPAATEAFQHVINYYADKPGDEDGKTADEVYRIKQTVDNINQRWHFDFAEVVRLDNSHFQPQPSLIPNSSYSGFGVLSADYRMLQGLGPLNSEVSVYGRFLWTNKNRSLAVERDLSQAGLGFSIKPLGDYDLHLSMERIFKVGSDTLNDWMVRASSSFSEGTYWHPATSAWGYYDLYLDAAYLLESGQHYLTSNLQWGRAYKVRDAWAVVPYFTCGAVDSNGNTWIDAGAGLTLAIWGFEDRDHAHRLLTRITLEGRQQLAGNSPDEHTVRLKYEMRF